MWVCDTTVCQELVKLGVGVARVADVLVLAFAVCAALSFEGPNQAAGLVSVLGDFDFMSLHHG